VAHGWLGVEGATATGTLGAQVVKVEAGSPAAGRLQPGEVITGIGDVPIRTMADLRARLYVMAPSTTVALLVEDGTTAQVVDVTLGASP
jgi:putative serine protease PepD